MEQTHFETFHFLKNSSYFVPDKCLRFHLPCGNISSANEFIDVKAVVIMKNYKKKLYFSSNIENVLFYVCMTVNKTLKLHELHLYSLYLSSQWFLCNPFPSTRGNIFHQKQIISFEIIFPVEFHLQAHHVRKTRKLLDNIANEKSWFYYLQMWKDLENKSVCIYKGHHEHLSYLLNWSYFFKVIGTGE